MSCDKCEDIHIAQRAGKQNDECHCSCHSGTSFRFSYEWPIPLRGDPPMYRQPCTGDPMPWGGDTWCGGDKEYEL